MSTEIPPEFELLGFSGLEVAALSGTATHARTALELELILNQERDDDREQRGSLDEGCEDDRAILNACCHLRLTSHSIHCLPSETSDSNAGADYGETRANTRAEHTPRARVLAGKRCCSLE
jgi:hypothetical protein